MKHDLVQLVDGEEPVAPDRRVLRRDGLERRVSEVTREDDVHDVLRGEGALWSDRIDDRHGTFDGYVVVEPDFLVELAMQRVHQALPGVDTTPRQQPVLLPVLLVATQKDPVAARSEEHTSELQS